MLAMTAISSQRFASHSPAPIMGNECKVVSFD